MRVIVLDNQIINSREVNCIRHYQVPVSKMYKIKVEMVNGSAFETEDKYTESEVLEKLSLIQSDLVSNTREIVI